MIGDHLLRSLSRKARRRGNAARDAGQWSEAVTQYRRYLGWAPQDRAIWIQLGHMLSEGGDHTAADRAYAHAAELAPEDGDLLLCWGHSRKRAGDLAGARSLYLRSHATDGNSHAADEAAALELDSLLEEPQPEQPATPETRAEETHHEPPPPRPAWAARLEVVRPFLMPENKGEVALFVTHSATGALKPHVAPYLRALRAAGIAILLVAVTDRELSIPAEVLDLTAGTLVRENAGYDFAAWAHAIHLYPEAYGAATLYLINDSLIGPVDQNRFAALVERVRADDADLVGLTESHEYRWHLQTYFLALKPRLLSSWRLQAFFAGVQILHDKDAVIRAYEVRFTGEMEQAGHSVAAMFPSGVAMNPTLHDWRGLLGQGFPFVKALLLRGVFPDADLTDWRAALAEAGFDLDLIDTTVRASNQAVPSEDTGRLFARRIADGWTGDRPLKVAFYGPWNYDNGLGHASRGIIAAIGRSGVRLNLHPIKKSFHIHRPLAPAVDIVDFAGDADIAVVHLNPDSWFLLTDEQRDAIRRARRRIGYWVWEMGHLPPAWRHDFSSVDRIWSPSRYCAELFAGEDEAPVDVIPHAVPLPPSVPLDRTAVLAPLGIAPAARIILYVFDGSSYLIRKNPAALVRAFAAAGLAERGWRLVLKTKHLLDRPEEGLAFSEMAEGTPGVVVIDSTLPAGTVAELVAAADIYASPHCSEGFGLTIAEAMAAGKPVVATDFGGSADFLDVATGYPVKSRPWQLAENHGHYTAGGEWARIDEPALIATLLRAAAAVERGDNSIGEAARARVGACLSYEAVGQRIAASFRDVMTGRGANPRADRLTLRLDPGRLVEEGDQGDGVGVVALAPDGTPRDTAIPSSHRWVLFAPEGATLAPDLARIITEEAQHRPDAAIFYADDVAGVADPAIDQLRLKPEFDRTLLAAQDYVGAPVIVRADALARIGPPDPAMRTAALADLLFRASDAGLVIARLPHVLLAHPGERVCAAAADYRAMLEAQPSLARFHIVNGPAPDSFATLARFGPDAPSVTLVIPTRRGPLADGTGSYLERLLGAIATTDWPMDRLHVLVGDDLPGSPAWAEADWPFTLRRIETPRRDDEPFNYAAKMNQLWRAAETEQLILLNDDCRPTGSGWLRALMSFAVDATIGGVGARLLFEDGRLQHAGMAPHGPGAAHSWIFRERAEGTYQEWARVQREWSMVTGAVFATRHSVLDEVDGFDERFSLEFNDTDLCLRLRARGYRIVCTPLAEMVHTEKASRGDRLPPGNDMALFLSRWRAFLEADPSWHPRLRRDRIDVTPAIDWGAWYL